MAEAGGEAVKETVGEATEGAFVAVAVGAEAVVDGTGAGLAADGGAGPVAGSIAEAFVAGVAHDDAAGGAALAGDGGGAAEGAEGIAVSVGEGSGSFSEEGSGEEDVDAGLGVDDGSRVTSLEEEFAQACAGRFALGVEGVEEWEEECDMDGRGMAGGREAKAWGGDGGDHGIG